MGGGAGRERPNTARGHLAEFAAGVAPADKTLQVTRGKVLERCMEQETSDGKGVPRRLLARREVAIRRWSALLQKDVRIRPKPLMRLVSYTRTLHTYRHRNPLQLKGRGGMLSVP